MTPKIGRTSAPETLRQLLTCGPVCSWWAGWPFSCSACPPARLAVAHTGEEEFAAQVKGLTDLLSDLLRPRLDLAPDAAIQYVDVNPFGVNVFLEQEAEPAKREQAVAMAAAAGYHWLRQEFPWEDIEIHGKGDFEDRRHEPYRSAWDKYDPIVALAEKYDLELIVRLSNPPAWSRAQGDDVGTYAPPDNVQDFADFVDRRRQPLSRPRPLLSDLERAEHLPRMGRLPHHARRLCRAAQGRRRARRAPPTRTCVIIAGALAATINLQPARPAARQQPERPALLAAHV